MAEYILLEMNTMGCKYEDIISEFEKYTDKLILSKVEIAPTTGKSHIHGRFTLKQTKVLKNLRDQIKRKFGKCGQDLKIKPWDPKKGNGTAYILKEGEGHHSGYSQDIVDKALDDVKSFKERVNKKKPKSFTQNLISNFEDNIDNYLCPKAIIDYVIQSHIDFYQPFLQSNIEKISNLLIMLWEERNPSQFDTSTTRPSYKNRMIKSIQSRLELEAEIL